MASVGVCSTDTSAVAFQLGLSRLIFVAGGVVSNI